MLNLSVTSTPETVSTKLNVKVVPGSTVIGKPELFNTLNELVIYFDSLLPGV